MSLKKEQIIPRRIIFDIKNSKMNYEQYCESLGFNKLEQLASDDTTLNLTL